MTQGDKLFSSFMYIETDKCNDHKNDEDKK